jgi:hypothetical protein
MANVAKFLLTGDTQCFYAGWFGRVPIIVQSDQNLSMNRSSIDLGEPYEKRMTQGAQSMKVTVEIDEKWVRIARSPIYFIVSALTGVSVTFAPLFLYWSGRGKFYSGYEEIVVPLCFAVIYCVPIFYFRLGSVVARELRQDSR